MEEFIKSSPWKTVSNLSKSRPGLFVWQNFPEYWLNVNRETVHKIQKERGPLVYGRPEPRMLPTPLWNTKSAKSAIVSWGHMADKNHRASKYPNSALWGYWQISQERSLHSAWPANAKAPKSSRLQTPILFSSRPGIFLKTKMNLKFYVQIVTLMSPLLSSEWLCHSFMQCY